MKAGQFSNEQIVATLQEATRGEKTIATLCRDKGISEATFYAWRQKFGGMNTKEVQRLRELEKAGWQRDYNEERLHSSLGYVTPNEFAARWAEEAENRSMTKAALRL